MKKFTTWLLVACLIPWLTGCESASEYTLTGRMWDDGVGDKFQLPAAEPNLKLAQTADGKDVVVQYDEAFGANSSTKRRAYLLLTNQSRVANHRKPHFIAIARADALAVTPLEINSLSNVPAGDTALCVNIRPDKHGFVLFSNRATIGSYELPVYSRNGTTVRAFLTPLTVTGDVIIYASLVGIVVMYCCAGSQQQIDLKPAELSH
jgi:hypothetical protein